MPQKRRDAVHRHFTFDAKSNKSLCKLCGNYLKGKHTSNLKAHLSTKHYAEYSEVTKINKETRASMEPPPLKQNGTRIDDKDRINTLKHLCLQLVAIHGHPLALISDDPFRKILTLAAMTPSATSSNAQKTKEINEQSVRLLISEVANDIKLQIASEIRNTLISLKVDFATCMGRKFIGVNIQYMKTNKIIIRNLAISEILKSPTAEFLRQKLSEILDEFNITTDQIYSVTTDNESNMTKLLKKLKGTYCPSDLLDNWEDDSDSDNDGDVQVEESEEPINLELLLNVLSMEKSKIRRILCPARILQLAIKDAIDENTEVQVNLDVARKISRMLRIPRNKIQVKLANLNVPIIDCATRWPSTYNMLVQLQSLKGICENIPAVSRLISVQFWDDIDQFIICLKPLYNSALFLQEQQLTVGDFYISWMNCKAKISKYHHSFAFSLLESMDNREKELFESDVVLEALYLDGRVSIVLSQEQCQKAKVLLNETREKLQQYKNNLPVVSDTDTSETSSSKVIEIKLEPVPSSSTDVDFVALEHMLLEVERARGNHDRSTSSFNVCLQDLQSASRMPLETDIIGHWSNKSTMHTELAMVARIVLATPLTQMSMEQMFTSLKFILSPLRSDLDPSLLKQMLLIKANKDLL